MRDIDQLACCGTFQYVGQGMRDAGETDAHKEHGCIDGTGE